MCSAVQERLSSRTQSTGTQAPPIPLGESNGNMVIVAALIVLVVGDFASTFFYHVPQHLWFTLHLRTHHDRRKSYWDHAVLSRDPAVLLDGLLGALPYLTVAAWTWHISWEGTLLGLAAGQFHVWWRHTTEIGWRT